MERNEDSKEGELPRVRIKPCVVFVDGRWWIRRRKDMNVHDAKAPWILRKCARWCQQVSYYGRQMITVADIGRVASIFPE